MTKITNQNYPNGLNPLGYMGVNAPTPGQQVVQLNRAPTPTDAQNFTIGTQWLADVSGVQQIWELVSLAGGVATWVQLYPAGGGSGGASEFPTDNGTANEVGGVLNVFGGPNINTVGSGDTVTVGLDTTITVDGIRDTSMSQGVVVSDGSGNLSSIAGVAGQVLTSNGPGMVPTFQGEAAGGAVTALHADNNVNVTPTVGIITVAGGNGITTFGAGSTLTLNLTAPVSIANGGTNATTMGTNDGVVYFDGTRLVTTASAGTAGQVLTSNGAGMAPTFQPGGGGGGGITQLTANTGGAATASSIKLQGNNVITTNGVPTGEIDFSLVNGTNGQLLIGGGTQPTWNNLTSTGGTVAISYPSNNHINLEASGTAPAAGCAFLYYQPSIANNVTGDGTIYGLGSAVIMTRLYDLGTNVTPGDGAGTPAQFTAPATGIYFFSMQCLPRNTGTINVGTCIIQVTGTSVQQYAAYQQASAGYSVPRPTPMHLQVVIPMTNGDIATFQWSSVSGGTIKNASLWGPGNFLLPQSALFYQSTWFCGYRVA